MSGYGSPFSRYYDELTANIDYKKRADYFCKIIEKFKKTDGKILVDIACGTGGVSLEMARHGFNVIGSDSSIGMLNAALDKKIESKLPVQFIHQDMRKLELGCRADVFTCALDSINHLKSIEDVKKTFESVSRFIKKDGIFIFDVNTVYKHRNIISNNTFTYETDNVYCIWENTLNDKTNEIKINLEFFELLENGLYRRSSESFCENVYTPDIIEKLLKETGFEILACYGDDTFAPPKSDTQRLVYAARKKEVIDNE